MPAPRLSICIPTKDFGSFIGETLNSVAEQNFLDVEVVILDGGSKDATTAVVESFRQRLPSINYIRHEEAGGVDADLAAAISAAKGDYCLLLSADDVLKPGSLRRILEEIKLGYDTYIFNRTECDRQMRPFRERYWLAGDQSDNVFDFSQPEQLLAYLQLSKSLGALFSYISSIVFVRERWLALPEDGTAAGTNYQHAYRLLRILLDGGRHKYIRQSLVFCRGQNDSFLEKGDRGVVSRFLLDVDGYQLLSERLQLAPRARDAFLNVMQFECHWFLWVRLAIRLPDDQQWGVVRAKLRRHGYSWHHLVLLSMLRRMESVLPVFKIMRRVRADVNRHCRSGETTKDGARA